jgi:hypothetical protein
MFFPFANYSSATRTSIHACRQLSRHIVALEEDEDTFNRVLKPLKSVQRAVKAPSIVVAPTQATQGTQKRQPALKRSRPKPSQ